MKSLIKNLSKLERATLGGGCFWCLEAVYQQIQGVKTVVSGYAGGAITNPSYEAVCSGNTGHAEIVDIEFDPQVISFRDLLEVFFVIHDPTTLNYQGNDHGTQYRSVILPIVLNKSKLLMRWFANLRIRKPIVIQLLRK